jgi:hypothetical protein
MLGKGGIYSRTGTFLQKVVMRQCGGCACPLFFSFIHYSPEDFTLDAIHACGMWQRYLHSDLGSLFEAQFVQQNALQTYFCVQ